MNKRMLYFDMTFTSMMTSLLFSFIAGYFHYRIDIDTYQMNQDFGLYVLFFYFMTVLFIIFILAPANYFMVKLGNVKGPILLSVFMGIFIIAVNESTIQQAILNVFVFLTPMFCIGSRLMRYFLDIKQKK
ncbi:hypothetical protein HUG15_20000 [Salicibibacter cibarius]|uniref:Uncharacterized protein n=1 Tax=Salicibibacter cibarius TaxID=2743000 RepID=A0A7T7CD55_9BACI|nr:hypothetical protein [Salicibibacter cibarius]QQK77642.1 hypothetical protein HUG15_20000 [Salicibibacter cibarius]